MPTKRPDQLPEGEDFDFEDILMVEKGPETEERKLYKSQLREFMKSALKMDPERMGENAILGMQSKFDWLIEQMEKLSSSPLIDVENYADYESPSKEKEQLYVTPTPTPTPSITPTPSVTPEPIDPGAPRPSPTPTPTPSVSGKPLTLEKQIEIEGRQDIVFLLPEQHKPERHGYTQWQIKAGQDAENVYINFFGFFPDEFNNTALNEQLLSFIKVNNELIRAEVGLVDSFGDLQSTQGMVEGSSMRFTIIYS